MIYSKFEFFMKNINKKMNDLLVKAWKYIQVLDQHMLLWQSGYT